MRLKNEKGLLSLEASITVTLFLFLMLFLYSFFAVFETRNKMGHTLLAATNSLSLDSYANSNPGSSGHLMRLLLRLYNTTVSGEGSFVSSEKWSEIKKRDVNTDTWDGSIHVPSSDGSQFEPNDYGRTGAASPLLASVIKSRFIAYLSGGNETEANDILRKYHIIGGVDGLDFSGSFVDKGKKRIYIKVRYTLECEFNPFGLGELEFEQSACSRMWE